MSDYWNNFNENMAKSPAGVQAQQLTRQAQSGSDINNNFWTKGANKIKQWGQGIKDDIKAWKENPQAYSQQKQQQFQERVNSTDMNNRHQANISAAAGLLPNNQPNSKYVVDANGAGDTYARARKDGEQMEYEKPNPEQKQEPVKPNNPEPEPTNNSNNNTGGGGGQTTTTTTTTRNSHAFYKGFRAPSNHAVDALHDDNQAARHDEQRADIQKDEQKQRAIANEDVYAKSGKEASMDAAAKGDAAKAELGAAAGGGAAALAGADVASQVDPSKYIDKNKDIQLKSMDRAADLNSDAYASAQAAEEMRKKGNIARDEAMQMNEFNRQMSSLANGNGASSSTTTSTSTVTNGSGIPDKPADSEPSTEGQQAGPEGQQAGPEGQQAGPEGQQAGPEGQQAGPEGQQAGPEGPSPEPPDAPQPTADTPPATEEQTPAPATEEEANSPQPPEEDAWNYNDIQAAINYHYGQKGLEGMTPERAEQLGQKRYGDQWAKQKERAERLAGQFSSDPSKMQDAINWMKQSKLRNGNQGVNENSQRLANDNTGLTWKPSDALLKGLSRRF